MGPNLNIPERKTYTYQDYAQLPERAPYELINGQLMEEPSPTPYHQDIGMKLSNLLFNYLQDKGGAGKVFSAPLDVYFEDKETFQPDVIIISKERLDIIKEKNIQGAPDIVFEILSPSIAYYDPQHKKDVYARHRVKEYWIIDPMDQSVKVYEQNYGEFELKSRGRETGTVSFLILPGFTVSLDNIF